MLATCAPESADDHVVLIERAVEEGGGFPELHPANAGNWRLSVGRSGARKHRDDLDRLFEFLREQSAGSRAGARRATSLSNVRTITAAAVATALASIVNIPWCTDVPGARITAGQRSRSTRRPWRRTVIGTRLGQYEIVAALGAGGMGEVYRATDARLGRAVAIKVLSARLAADESPRARFEREAEAVAALSHPNILAIHEFGPQDGLAFAGMELLEGETLRARLDRGALPMRKLLISAGR
jgi:hypothetical protein